MDESGAVEILITDSIILWYAVMGKKGTHNENTVAREVTRRTSDSVHCWVVKDRVAVDAPDILLVMPGGIVGFELKTTDGDWKRLTESELEQLLDVGNNYIDVAVVIDFNHREPVFIEPSTPPMGEFDVEGGPDPIENFMLCTPDETDPCRTDGGQGDPTLSVTKPPLDDWPSATQGRDAIEKILDRYVNDDLIESTEVADVADVA